MKSPVKSFTIAFILIIGLLVNPIQSALAAPAPSGLAQATGDQIIESAFNYLATQQNPDGGLPWLDETSSPAVTLRAVLALAANHFSQDLLASEEGLTPLDYLETAGVPWVNQEETETPALSIARAGQLLTAVAAANADPQQFGDQGANLIYLVNENYDSNTGIYGAATSDNVTDQIWAILGLTANNFGVPQEAADWLASAQGEDGTWNDGYGSYLDTTPLALMALLSSGQYDGNSDAIVAGVAYMTENQEHDGGWQSEWDSTTNASITGAMLQVIAALGDVPMSGNWQLEAGNPYSAIQALQQESGVIGGDYANAYSTADALLGISGQPLFRLGDLTQAANAFDYLFAAQDSAGGWNSVGQTVDVILAVEAAGWQPSSLQIEGNTALNYLEASLGAYLESGPDAVGKAILGVQALGQDPTDFAGLNLSDILMEEYDETAAAFGDPANTWHQAFAILGLSAAGSAVPQDAVATLISLQQDDGGWEYAAGFGSWPDNTALTIQALLAAGIDATDPVIEDAMAYIHSMQTEDGGWGDASTTAYVLMALNALGESDANWVTANASDPITSLMSYQKANGSFVYSWEYADDSVMATASALLALFGGDYLAQKVDTTPTAALLIDPGEGATQIACVPLATEPISGLDLLDTSGFEYDSQDGFINSILGVANADGETNYWSYWAWDGREWVFQSTGANDSVVHPGTIEAWHFTSWEIYPSLPSDTIPMMANICDTGKLLKDYNVEPYLAYNDLYHAEPAVVSEPITEEPIEAAEAITEEAPAADATEQNPAEATPESAAEDEPLSTAPIIILGVLAVIVIMVVVVMIHKKKNDK